MQVTKADSIYFDQRSSIQLIMELLLRDINNLPPFGFLQIDHGTDEFWGLVEARRQIVRLETESFLGNEARRLIRQAQEKKDFEPILEGMQIDATSRRAPNTRKRSDTTKEKQIIAVLAVVIKRVLSIALHLFRITVKEDCFVLIIVDFMKIILVLDRN